MKNVKRKYKSLKNSWQNGSYHSTLPGHARPLILLAKLLSGYSNYTILYKASSREQWGSGRILACKD